MARNSNSLKWLIALLGWASVFGRALRERISQAFTGSAASRVARSKPQDAAGAGPRKEPRLFLLYTENTGNSGLRNIKTALDRRFPGYTLEPKALGRYKGKSEASVIAHIVTRDRKPIEQAAAEICELNGQESVLYIELAAVWTRFVPRSNVKKEHGRIFRPASAGKSHSRVGARKQVSKVPQTLQQGEKQP